MRPSAGGLLPDRGRWRNAVNLLLCIAGVGGVVLGGWALHGSYESHQDRKASRALIAKACAGLVDPDTVMGLDGGTDRVVLGGENPSTVDFETVPDACVLSRLEERKGRDVKVSQFSLRLKGLPRQRDPHLVGPGEAYFGYPDRSEERDLTARTRYPVRAPLGDGGLGDYGPDDVTVTARCDQPIPFGATSLVVIASSPSTRDEAGDRKALARLARQAAVGAAEKYGCRTRLPELPAELPAPAVDLGPVAGRADTCGWYAAHLRATDQGRLPDRAVGAPFGGAARQESCLLAVGAEGTKRIFPQLAKEDRGYLDLDDVLRVAPWWVRTDAYFGDDAAVVAVKAARVPEPVPTGRAGRIGHVLYGSATCQGRPATFTMTVSNSYRYVLGAGADAVFKTYVTETAGRRGCTDPVLPPAQ
ncbi:hypothetical protein ACWDYJ_29120 [Streptomyces sp. NPDC003042]